MYSKEQREVAVKQYNKFSLKLLNKTANTKLNRKNFSYT